MAAVGRCHTPHLARIGQGLSFLLLQQPDNQNTSLHNATTLGDLWTSLLHFNRPSDPSYQPLKLVLSNWWSKKLSCDTGVFLRWESCSKRDFLSTYGSSLYHSRLITSILFKSETRTSLARFRSQQLRTKVAGEKAGED